MTMKGKLLANCVTFLICLYGSVAIASTSVNLKIETVEVSQSSSIEIIGSLHSDSTVVAMFSDVIFSDDVPDEIKRRTLLKFASSQEAESLNQIMESYYHIRKQILTGEVSWIGVETDRIYEKEYIKLIEKIDNLGMSVEREAELKKVLVYLLGPPLYLKYIESENNTVLKSMLEGIEIHPIESSSARKMFERASNRFDKSLKAARKLPEDLQRSLTSLLKIFPMGGSEISKQQVVAASSRVQGGEAKIVKKFLYAYRDNQMAFSKRDQEMAKRSVDLSRKLKGKGLVLVGSRHMRALPGRISVEALNPSKSTFKRIYGRIQSLLGSRGKCRDALK